MSKGDEKTLESNNIEKINEMVLNFRQCADAASQLSNSVEKFTNVYTNIENNVVKLDNIEKNLSSNNYIKGLMDATSSMKDIFEYFNSSIPELSKYMQSSKKELDSYKDEFQFVDEYLKNLPKHVDEIKFILNENMDSSKNMLGQIQEQIDDKSKKIDSNQNKIKKKISDDIKKYLDSELERFQGETVTLINENFDRIISEKFNYMFNEFDNIINNLIETFNISYYNSEKDTIYNLYVHNNRKLPISVKKPTWFGNFYFKVERIENVSNGDVILGAFGRRFKDDKVHDVYQTSADLKQFEMYVPDSYGEYIMPVDDGDIPF